MVKGIPKVTQNTEGNVLQQRSVGFELAFTSKRSPIPRLANPKNGGCY